MTSREMDSMDVEDQEKIRTRYQYERVRIYLMSLVMYKTDNGDYIGGIEVHIPSLDMIRQVLL